MSPSNENSSHDILTLLVNGENHSLILGEGLHQVSTSHTLAYVLRERLGFTGTKISCDNGACGCCTVMLEGQAVLSCMLLAVECTGKAISTIEDLSNPSTGTIDPLQQSFIDHTAFQCGFCTPGIIMSAKALLNEDPSPSRDKVQAALAGNFCRCNSHYHVVDAVMAVAKKGADK